VASRKEQSSTVFLLRHAQSSANLAGVLAGRTPGIHLTSQGKRDASKLKSTLQKLDIQRVALSPLERCFETAAPFLRTANVDVYEDEAFLEMDYGLWSNRKLKDLAHLPLWKNIQKKPSIVRFPDGESFVEMQSRALTGLSFYAKKSGNTLIVSHGDVIRVMIAKFYGLPLDGFQKIAVSPASLSILSFSNGIFSVKSTNIPINLTSRTRSNLGGGN
jgi:probable phosphomutase (TIGR03848 family)